MTGMLASVTTIAEAEIALQANVDIIDIKNPHEGALGALEINGVKDIVRKVNRVVPTSATIGDIKPDDPDLFKYILDMSDTGVDYVKVGLFENKISDNFIKVISNAAKNINLVVLDTRDKSGKNLRSILNEKELLKFVETAKQFNLLTGLAGSLCLDDIQPLLALNPDYLGFRGALCSENNRVKTINSGRVKKIRSAVPVSKFINYDGEQSTKAKCEVINGSMA